jgi:hypothetical protein
MEPHRFRPHLDTLEVRDTPSATPADVLSASLYAVVATNVINVYAERLAGPLRTDTLNQYKNVLPQVALADGWAAKVLNEFQAALDAQAAADPAAAAALAPLAQRVTDLQGRAMLGTASADVLGVSIGVPSVLPKLAQTLSPTDPAPASSNTTDGSTNTTPGSDSGTTNPPPLSTADASGMSDTIPPLDDPHWQAMPDGLRVWDVVQGDGTPVQANSKITVYYTGWLKSDGTQFETNRTGTPNQFDLSGLIKGWQEALPGMKPGGLRRLDIPSALAYGPNGSPPKIPGNADLVFEIKMIAVN